MAKGRLLHSQSILFRSLRYDVLVVLRSVVSPAIASQKHSLSPRGEDHILTFNHDHWHDDHVPTARQFQATFTRIEAKMEERRKRVRISAHVSPPEVWLRIHRWATFVPNAFDKDVPDPFSYPAPLSQDEIQDQMRRSLKTKRSLVLVCKLWNELSTRFLYEAVYIGLTKTLRTLDTLLAKDLDDEETSRTKSAMKLWTKRLDFAIRDPNKKDITSLRFACVLESFMSNLEVCVVRKTDMQNLFSKRLLSGFSSVSETPFAIFDSTHELCDGSESQLFFEPDATISDDDWETKYDTSFWCFELYRLTSLRRLNIVPRSIPWSAVQVFREATASGPSMLPVSPISLPVRLLSLLR